MSASLLIDPDPAADAERAMALLGVTHDQLLAELNFRRLTREAKCLREIAAAQKTGGVRRFLRGEGGGEVEMMIHPTSYHYWGQRLGYECWDDPTFRREYRRDNPVARVKSVSDRLTIVKPNLAPNKPVARRGVVGKRGRWAA